MKQYVKAKWISAMSILLGVLIGVGPLPTMASEGIGPVY